MSALAAEGLSIRFGGVQALDDVSLNVASGELVGLIGPNGAGKTTLLHLLTGVLKPDAGHVMLQDQTVTGLGVHERTRRGLAMTHQIVRPLRGMSALKNVMIAAAFRRTTGPVRAFFSFARQEEAFRSRAILDRLGVGAHADRATETLPLGVLKRLEVARALALEPRVILLDEPLAGLNSGEAQALAETIGSLHRDGLTIVLIEHNLGEVVRIAERLVVLVAGRIVADGAPRETIALPIVREAYIGTADADS